MGVGRSQKPNPDCVWDEKAHVWRWPDDRSDEERQADELAAELAQNGDWEAHGFKRTHAARVDSDSSPR